MMEKQLKSIKDAIGSKYGIYTGTHTHTGHAGYDYKVTTTSGTSNVRYQDLTKNMSVIPESPRYDFGPDEDDKDHVAEVGGPLLVNLLQDGLDLETPLEQLADQVVRTLLEDPDVLAALRACITVTYPRYDMGPTGPLSRKTQVKK